MIYLIEGMYQYGDSWIESIHKTEEGAEAKKLLLETNAKFNNNDDVIYAIRERELED